MANKEKAKEPQEYVCTRPCYHNNRHFKKGQRAFFVNDYPKDKKGKLVHFERV